MDTSNPATLAASLRAVGCPEPILRNLVTAAINRDCQRQKDELGCIEDFWLDGAEKEAEEKRRVVALIKLEKERQSLIEDLLHIPWYRAPFLNDRTDGSPYQAFMAGFLDEARGEEFMDLFLETRLKTSMFQALNEHRRSPETAAEASDLIHEFNERLDQIMTPAQREELEIRMFEMSYFDVWKEQRHFGAKLAPQELREALRILKPDQLVPFDADDFLPHVETEQRKLERSRQLRALLGESRFSVFLHNHNGDPSLNPYYGDEGKPTPATYLQLFTLQESVLQQVADLHAYPGLSAEQRQSALVTLIQQAEQTTTALVPADYYTNYLNGGGQWLRNMRQTYAP